MCECECERKKAQNWLLLIVVSGYSSSQMSGQQSWICPTEFGRWGHNPPDISNCVDMSLDENIQVRFKKNDCFQC